MGPIQSTVSVSAAIADEVRRRYTDFLVTQDSPTASRCLRIVQATTNSASLLILVVLMKHGEHGSRKLTREESDFFAIQKQTHRPTKTNMLFVSQHDAELRFKWYA
jgi:hypothetical protein